MEMEREPNTIYTLSLSYGKDSIASIEACKQLGYPIDRIIHAEIWATDDISADLPPMVEFKKKADAIIKERYGIEVEHVCATAKDGSKQTYEKIFYRIPKRRKGSEAIQGTPKGYPKTTGSWCKKLKIDAMPRERERESKSTASPKSKGIGVPRTSRNKRYGFPTLQAKWCSGMLKQNTLDKAKGFSDRLSVITYLGIAADEPPRIERYKDRKEYMLPLVDIGWDEAYCRKWCEENDLLSPIYTTATRGGCWFCHNQGVNQLRLLRKNYPKLWELLLKWDNDSPVTFHADGHTVHDFDKRFALEDEGCDLSKFRWSMLDEGAQYTLF